VLLYILDVRSIVYCGGQPIVKHNTKSTSKRDRRRRRRIRRRASGAAMKNDEIATITYGP
jgi:hypothetical protein